MNTKHQEPAMRVLLQTSGGTAKFTYQLSNWTNVRLLLFNKMFKALDSAGRYVIERDLCIVDVDGDAVRVGKKLFSIPSDTFVEKPITPCLTILSPGETATETLTLPLPLRRWNPYLNKGQDSERKIVPGLPVYFEIGYFPEAPGTMDLALRVQTSEGALIKFDPFPEDSQSVLAVGPLPQRLDVLI